MNFVSERDHNWNQEILDSNKRIDLTKERVDGGKLKQIDIFSNGNFCIKFISFSCGSSLNSKLIEASILINAEAFRKAWLRKFPSYPQYLRLDLDKNCVWFGYGRSFVVDSDAFLECSHNSVECISEHIYLY